MAAGVRNPSRCRENFGQSDKFVSREVCLQSEGVKMFDGCPQEGFRARVGSVIEGLERSLGDIGGRSSLGSGSHR